MKPEKKTLGRIKAIDICSACIWFSALRRDEQAEAEQRKNVNQSRKRPSRRCCPAIGNEKHEMHDPEKEKGHEHSDAEIGDQFPEHQAPAAQRTNE